MILNAWLLGAGVAMATCHSGDLERFEGSQLHMGTKFIIVLYAPNEELANEGFRAAFARIAALDATLSDYNSDSELSRLSSSAPTPHPVGVSRDLWAVLEAAQDLSCKTDGAFDVTSGPLTKLWRRARNRHQMPSESRLNEARTATGHASMVLDEKQRAVQLLKPKMRLDVGGIAKGYAVDQALAALEHLGIERAMVNASGDMSASKAPPGKLGWLVGVAPLEPAAPPSLYGYLVNQSVATSGDAFQYVEIDGKRYSHIVDPHTGIGLTLRSSVTILATDGMVADAAASAVSVLGPAAGLRFVQRQPGVEVLIVTQENGKVHTQQTDGFRRWGTAHPLPSLPHSPSPATHRDRPRPR